MMTENGIITNTNATRIITIDSIIYDNREDINRYDTELESNRENNKFNKFNNCDITTEPQDNNLPVVIYRFKFTEEFMEYLYNFAKIHQYDDRKDFKEAWNVWTEENENLIDQEMRRLLNLGYEGDVLDKMFKSARYYFRKKSTEKKEPRQRRQYISVNRDLLDTMDSHIEDNIYDANYQPKTGFIKFCKDNETLLKETISKIFEQGIKDSELIEDKIKKTYKNRYFMLINKK
jgi:hypothetical protein